MAQLVYGGPFRDGVSIPLLGIEEIVPGVPFEVADEGAVTALLAQGTFELAGKPAATPPAKGTDSAAPAGED